MCNIQVEIDTKKYRCLSEVIKERLSNKKKVLLSGKVDWELVFVFFFYTKDQIRKEKK